MTSPDGGRLAFAQYLPRLLAAALIEWVGSGMFMAASVIYFVRIVGLPEQSVGLGMTLAGLAAMGAAVPVGQLADRIGVRQTLVVLNLWRAAAMVGYIEVRGWWGFLLVTMAAVSGDQSMLPLVQALVGERAATGVRRRVMAAHRTTLNLGISLGGLAAAAPLAIDTAAAYHWMFAATAATFAAAAVLVASMPKAAGIRRPPARREHRLTAFRDLRLVLLAGYDSVLALWLPILNVAFPLWLTTRSAAPAAAVGPLYAVNTLLCVLLYLPSSRLAADVRAAARLYAAGACFLAVSCLAFAAASIPGTAVATAVFAGAISILTMGELCQVNASWTLSFALAPTGRRAEYLSAFGLGRISSTRVYGPVLMTGVVLALGTAGWAMLTAMFTAASVLPLLASRRLPDLVADGA